MQSIMETIKNRRSIRRFEDREIPEDLLNNLYTAVQWAPSWANTQCWELVVVKDESIKKQLEECMAPKNPATRVVGNAPVVIAVCAKNNQAGYYNGAVSTKYGDWFMYDLGIATQNLCLAAHDQGLATVIVGLFDHDKASEILKVPDNYSLVTLIPVGFPAKDPSAPKRKPIEEIIHFEKF